MKGAEITYDVPAQKDPLFYGDCLLNVAAKAPRKWGFCFVAQAIVNH